jgi:hypothetical protein
MATSPHRRFYARQQDKVSIGKLQIKSGMIIEFNYRDKNKKTSRPLIFVMDTDEFVGREQKVFHGVNLNYIPHTEIEKFFEGIVSFTGFELDKETKFPKINLYEEEDPGGIRPIIIFKPLVKTKLLNRFDCWRSYKYKNTTSVKQIKYNFASKKLSEVYVNLKED